MRLDRLGVGTLVFILISLSGCASLHTGGIRIHHLTDDTNEIFLFYPDGEMISGYTQMRIFGVRTRANRVISTHFDLFSDPQVAMYITATSEEEVYDLSQEARLNEGQDSWQEEYLYQERQANRDLFFHPHETRDFYFKAENGELQIARIQAGSYWYPDYLTYFLRADVIEDAVAILTADVEVSFLGDQLSDEITDAFVSSLDQFASEVMVVKIENEVINVGVPVVDRSMAEQVLNSEDIDVSDLFFLEVLNDFRAKTRARYVILAEPSMQISQITGEGVTAHFYISVKLIETQTSRVLARSIERMSFSGPM
jgi:hypothetical protein